MYSDISLRDPTISDFSKKNPDAHYICVLLRLALSVAVYYDTFPRILLLVFALVFVGRSYVTRNIPHWKGYGRFITAYSVAYFAPPKLAASIIAADALIGAQSRHTLHMFENVFNRRSYSM